MKPSKDRKIVVFGGGNVALRKCRQFAGFDITVIADRTVPGIEDACDRVVIEHFDSSDLGRYLDGAFIAIAATDSQSLNAEIAKTSLSAGVLTNSAHGGGDILLPSSVRKRGYTVAVSSEGSVPAFPPIVAKDIDAFLGEEYDLMLDLLIKIRQDIKSVISTQPMRAKCLAEILDNEDIWHNLKDGDTEGAEKAAFAIREKYSDIHE
ncbi:siroheme synthase, N-terminal domain protein [Thermoplasmatales archaeon BRNA1]|nr:siroheme synthase, N-terminal domain protein [Thermoplasmatales archaeon BRNA1]